jgi:peptide/nickel transport system substrate-binding protein
VTFRFIPNDPSRTLTLLGGDVQLIDNVPTADYKKLRGHKDITVFKTSSNRMVHLQLDSNRDKSPFVTDTNGRPLDKNPLKDARVRRAISMAINRQAIVERVMEDLAVAAGQLMPDEFFGASPKLRPEPYDPVGARKLLVEAGYPDGFGLTIHGTTDRLVNDEQIVQHLAAMLSRIGINAKAEAMPYNVYIARAQKLEFSAVLQSWGVTTSEGTLPLRILVATFDNSKGLGQFNFGRYSNPKVDALLEQALATIDGNKRREQIRQATELVINDYGIIPLHFQVNAWAARKPLEYEPRTDERTYAHKVRPAR